MINESAYYNLQIIFELMEEDDNSQMFKVGDSQEMKVSPMPLFNKDTKIIEDGQRHKVIFGQMEVERKPLHEILAPYLYKFGTTTADYAAKAGSYTYEALKTGFLWVYNKFVNTVIPYAVENLPKIVFVIKKQEKPINLNSSCFEVIGVDEKDYESIDQKPNEKGRTRVVIPLGTNNDAHFEQYLKKQDYEVSYQFPIDQNSVDNVEVKKSFIMPSEQFQVVCQGVKEARAQQQIPVPIEQKEMKKRKKVIRMPNCFIFDLEGQNSIEYDLDIVESIQRCPDAKEGYIVFPEKTLRKSIREEKSEEMDPVGMLVQGKEEEKPEVSQQIEVVGRKVKVQIVNRRPPSTEQAFLIN